MPTRVRKDAGRNDRKFLGRSSPPQPIEVVAASGSHVRDARGRTFIDLQMGWCVGNLGWNPPEVVERVRRFEGPTYVAPGLLYAPWAELAERLVAHAPGRLAKAYRCVGGTEAVELALQLAMTATGRHKLVSIEDAYHGNSFGARSIGEGEAESLLRGCLKLAPPLDENALDRLETLLAHRDVAALILEPIVLNLDVLIPDSAFMRGLVALCHRYGTLVIADEVGTAFGRTGRRFASEWFGLEPDLVCLAKAIASGVGTLGAVLATAEVARDAEDLEFFSTFGWMPLQVEAALATQDVWRRRGDELLAGALARSAELRSGLHEIFADAELRIQGLAIAVDLGDEERVAKIEKRCREHGLLLFAEGEALVMFPALTIEPATVADALEILQSVTKRA